MRIICGSDIIKCKEQCESCLFLPDNDMKVSSETSFLIMTDTAVLEIETCYCVLLTLH
jgi:hypothetical protein